MSRPKIVVAVCTYRRNDLLAVMLESAAVAAEKVTDRADVGLVVVDDNPDGAARPVVERFAERFADIGYSQLGGGNISLARNRGLETALGSGADWIAMTDDDCEVPVGWLSSYLDAQAATGFDIGTSALMPVPPADAPAWLIEAPFFGDAQFDATDLAPMNTAATNNSFLRAELVSGDDPIRFREDLGVIGGEDMVFYRTLHQRGAAIRYVAGAEVTEHQPLTRCTYRYQLRSRFWLGNTEYVTNIEAGDASPTRMVLRGGRRLIDAAGRPVNRLVRGQDPQWRYTLASVVRSVGTMAGPLGLRFRHH